LAQERDRFLERLSQAESRARQAEGTGGEQAVRLKELKARLRRATDEREELSQQLAHERARSIPPDPTPKLRALRHRLEMTSGERDRLRRSLNQHEQATAREIATCRKEIEMIEDDRLKLRTRVLQLEKDNENLQRQIRSLEAENSAGADYIRKMRADQADDENDDEGYIDYDFSDDDEDY
jgi:septal ring factor EnvC (AmiA/AmiB activator)